MKLVINGIILIVITIVIALTGLIYNSHDLLIISVLSLSGGLLSLAVGLIFKQILFKGNFCSGDLEKAENDSSNGIAISDFLLMRIAIFLMFPGLALIGLMPNVTGLIFGSIFFFCGLLFLIVRFFNHKDTTSSFGAEFITFLESRDLALQGFIGFYLILFSKKMSGYFIGSIIVAIALVSVSLNIRLKKRAK